MTTLERPKTAPPLYAQDGQGYGATVHEHYFVAGCDWLVTEYDPDEDLAFGWACLHGDRQNAELGYVSLAELEEVRVPLVGRLVGHRDPDSPVMILEQVGYGVERDTGWPEGLTLTQAIEHLDRRQGR